MHVRLPLHTHFAHHILSYTSPPTVSCFQILVSVLDTILQRNSALTLYNHVYFNKEFN